MSAPRKPFSGAATAGWLAWRELTARKGRLALSAALVGLAVGLCLGSELLLRAREIAVATEIDAIGPAIQIAPADVARTDLVRLELGKKLFSEGIPRELLTRHAGELRAIEGRLVLRLPVDSQSLPVIGEELRGDQPAAPAGEVGLGSLAARQLTKGVGDSVTLAGRELRVARIAPPTGTVEDLAVFLPRQGLQELLGLEPSLNELRLFTLPQVDAGALAATLEREYPSLTVFLNDRGKVADHDTAVALRTNRLIIYSVTGSIVLLSLLLGALLNLRERTRELETLVAVGATRATVFLVVMGRALIVSVSGSVLGYLLGFLLPLYQGVEPRLVFQGSLELLFGAMAAAVALSALAVAPMLPFFGRRWNGFE